MRAPLIHYEKQRGRGIPQYKRKSILIAADALHELSSSAAPHGKEYHIGAEFVVGGSTAPFSA